jgi:hypothetical protein
MMVYIAAFFCAVAGAATSISCDNLHLPVVLGDSVQAALDTAGAAARACGGGATVFLQAGVHHLPAPLIVTAAHSHVWLRGPPFPSPGSPGSPPAILDGGVRLPPFSPQPDGTWLTHLPAANFSATSTPTTLSVGGVRRQRARSPNAVAGGGLAGLFGDAATYHAAGPLAACSAPAWGSCPPVDKWGFVYNKSEAASPPIDPAAAVSGAFALVFASWTAEWVPLGAQSFVQANSSLMFAQAAHTPVGTYGFAPHGRSPAGGRFLLENSRDFLDAPGEWFAAPLPDGRVWYLPLPGEAPQDTAATAAALATLVHVRGAAGAPVVGFSLTDVEVQNWGEWRPDARVGGDPSFVAAVMVDGAVNTTVARVALHAGASTGVAWGGDVEGLLLDRIAVFDAGGGGIGALYNNNGNAGGVVISNCTVHDVGDVYMSQPAGIAVGGRSVAVLHNEVHSVAYSGIIGVQPGGPPPLHAGAQPTFEIAFNNVTNFGLGVLNDFGGIYIAVFGECWLSNTCWLPADVHHNLVARGSSYNYGASAFYSDQALSGVALHHNVLAAVGAVAIEAHCGENNSGVNNVLFAPQLQAAGSREGAFGGCNSFGFPPGLSSGYSLTNNVVHLTATPWVVSGQFAPPNGDHFSPAGWWSDANVFFGAAPGAPMPLHYPNGTQGLPAWRAAWGCDERSVEADPQLVNPAGGDFNLLPSSPAWGLGWQRIDLSSVGPLPAG